MSSRNPNSVTSGSSSPSPSPNSGENRENIVPQREEFQADETVPKEEEQSAADTADSASKEEETPKQENPDEKFPKPENPDEEMAQEEEDPDEENPEPEIPQEENPKQEIPEQANPHEENPVGEITKPENPDEEMAQEEEDPDEENPEPEIPQEENPKQEIPEQANPYEEIPLEGEKLVANLSEIVADIQMDDHQQMFGDIEARNRQEAQIATHAQNQEQVQLLIKNWSNNLGCYGFFGVDSETLEYENAELDEIYAGNLANEPNRGSGNRGKENSTIENPQQENPHELEGDAIFSYLSNIVPDFELGIQQQITEDIEARKRQEVRVDSATLGYENVKSDAMYAENPDVNISKPENPDEKIPEEEDPKGENPDEEISKPEIPEPDAIYAGNLANEPNRGSGNRGKENSTIENPQQENPHELEGDALFSYLSNIVPDFELGVQQQITEDIEARKRQEVRVDSATLGYENVKSDAMYAENPDVNISKPENPDKKIPEEEDPKEENPDEEIPKPEIPEQANPHELEGEALFSYLSNIVPPFELRVQQQITEGIEVRNRQEVQIANQAQNQEQVLEAAPNSFHWSDNLEDYGFISEDSETFENENAELDSMYAKNLANEPNRESGNRGQENPTTDSIPTFDPNRGMRSGEFSNNTIAEILAAIPTVHLTWGLGIAQPENPTIADIHREPENPSFGDMFSSTAEMFALLPPIEPNRGNGNIYSENPTNAEIFAALPPKKRMKMLGNPTIDPTFDARPAINPNKGFTIRETQNPPNNPAPAAVPKQQNKSKGKDKNNPAPAAVPKQEDSDEEEDENPRLTKMCKCISESCFLFPRSTSEEEDDIVTMISVSAYSRNHRPLPSAGSPEHFDTLFAFISSHLPEGESISLETLKEKFAKLVRKYLRQLRQRDMHSYFEAFASDYERDLYRLGREVWGNAYAEGYRVPPGQVGTSGTSGDSS